jgi:hypothetical protein
LSLGFCIMQYTYTRNFEIHLILIEVDWMTIESKNVIPTLILNHHIWNGFGFFDFHLFS